MPEQNSLSPLEHEVMQVLWSRGPCSAEDVRQALVEDHPMKDSTVRTILRRMEEKEFVAHWNEGRTYIYRHLLPPSKAAAGAVRQIIDLFCNGSVEALLLGMVDNKILDREQLQELAERIDKAEARERRAS
jgi:BlaI family transcriptional regulator, penicillinase repressor